MNVLLQHAPRREALGSVRKIITPIRREMAGVHNRSATKIAEHQNPVGVGFGIVLAKLGNVSVHLRLGRQPRVTISANSRRVIQSATARNRRIQLPPEIAQMIEGRIEPPHLQGVRRFPAPHACRKSGHKQSETDHTRMPDEV